MLALSQTTTNHCWPSVPKPRVFSLMTHLSQHLEEALCQSSFFSCSYYSLGVDLLTKSKFLSYIRWHLNSTHLFHYQLFHFINDKRVYSCDVCRMFGYVYQEPFITSIFDFLTLFYESQIMFSKFCLEIILLDHCEQLSQCKIGFPKALILSRGIGHISPI